MPVDDADVTEGLNLLPMLADAVGRLERAGRNDEAAVARRCVELIRGGDPALAAKVWRANAESVNAALDLS